MKGIKLANIVTVLEHFITMKEANIVGNGLETEWKVEEFFTILMENWPMKGNGNRTNCADMEFFTTKK